MKVRRLPDPNLNGHDNRPAGHTGHPEDQGQGEGIRPNRRSVPVGTEGPEPAVTVDSATRRQQRLILAVALAVIGSLFFTAAAVVAWATTNHP